MSQTDDDPGDLVPASGEVLELLQARLRAVLGDDVDTAPTARFDEDLHADSLDLVEVVEGVERALAERGLQVHLPDDELLGLQTVGEAADALAREARPAVPGA